VLVVFQGLDEVRIRVPVHQSGYDGSGSELANGLLAGRLYRKQQIRFREYAFCIGELDALVVGIE
jgi:hypothetical protein